MAKDKPSSLFGLFVSDEEKSFITLIPELFHDETPFFPELGAQGAIN
jgi:hypothetical protein